MTKCQYCAGNKCFFCLTNFLITNYDSTAGGRISNWRVQPGGNSLIDFLNEVGGNQVKFRQAVHSSVGIRMILFKKTAKP